MPYADQQSRKRWRHANPEKMRAQRRGNYEREDKDKLRARDRANYDPIQGLRKYLRTKYNITLEEYERLLLAQNGVCAICRRRETWVDPKTGHPKRLAVDHDHACCHGEKSCGKCIRGLLCSACNTAIGFLRDDALVVRAAADYLEKGR